jgi:hypothetical protein
VLLDGRPSVARKASNAVVAIVALSVVLGAGGPGTGASREADRGFARAEAPLAQALPIAGKLRAFPSDPIVHERLRLKGRLGTHVMRPVVLQLRQGTGWLTLDAKKTKGDGTFGFLTRTRATTARYRVLARQVRVGGRSYAETQTPWRRVEPTPQSGELKMASSAAVGAATAIAATFAPARPGRSVALQRWSSGAWTKVATRSEDAEGRVSFSVTHGQVGTYRYRALALAAHGARQAGTAARDLVVSQTGPPAGPPFVTAVSSNGRYFVDQYGDPILVRGDSPWAILQDASTAQMSSYVATRESQGFNTVLLSLLGAVASGGPSNSGATYDGILPFQGSDPSQLNPAYWDRVAYFLGLCRDAGITVMAYPIDGWAGTAEYSGLAASWSTATATAYGRAVAARLSAFPNVIWSVGGDYPPPGQADDNARFWAVLQGLAEGGMDRISTIQFGLNQTSLSSTYWDDKVDFSFVYSYAVTYAVVQGAYQQTNPAGAHLPALMAEAHYEAYVGVTDLYLRSMAAWALTSGSPGEFYGSEEVWDTAPTAAALNTEAVSQLSALREAFGDLTGWQRLVPDFGSTFITSGRGTKGSGDGEYYSGNTYVTGGVTPDGTLAVIYLPAATSQTITIDQSKMEAGYSARWVDPTNGTSTPATAGSSYHKTGSNAAGDSDWLLVLESTR